MTPPSTALTQQEEQAAWGVGQRFCPREKGKPKEQKALKLSPKITDCWKQNEKFKPKKFAETTKMSV